MARFARSLVSSQLLRHPVALAMAALAGAGAIASGCTQNFGVFEPSGTSSGTGGSGTGGSTTTTTTTTTGAGGTGGSTTTTTTTGAGGTGGGTTTTTTTGVGGSGPEECTNGLDDDKNGKVDCEDEACMPGFTCVPSVPPSWNGPVTLFAGSPAMLPPGCPSEHPQVAYQGNKDIISVPASCSACSCSSPAVTCTPGVIAFRNQAGCANGVGMAAQPGDGMCGPINPPNSVEGYAGQSPMVSAGACSPSGGAPTIPPASWQTSALACTGGGQGTGCGAQAACVAKSGPPFDAALCVWRSGDKACPGDFTQKHLFVDNVVDNRDCSACTCGNATTTCTVVTSVYTSADCSGASIEVPNDQSCVAGGVAASIKPTITKSGSCAASGGQPIGSVQEGNSVTTVCCTQ